TCDGRYPADQGAVGRARGARRARTRQHRSPGGAVASPGSRRAAGAHDRRPAPLLPGHAAHPARTRRGHSRLPARLPRGVPAPRPARARVAAEHVRLLTYEGGRGAEAGVLAGERVVPAAALGAHSATVRGLLETLDPPALAELGERAEAADAGLPLESVRLLAPVPDPQKIICLGLNYRDHAAEIGQQAPAAPLWFAKFANSLIGDGEHIVLPAAHPGYVDYEAELAVVMGRSAHRVAVEDALAHVAGATAFNDVSARDLQLQNPLWT